MLKALKHLAFTAFALASISALPTHAAGTIPLAMAQQVDANGAPLANCQVYFFVAGTPATPQNAFSDFGLTQALPNPLSCDQTGRVPMFWLADGLIHVRLTDSTGLQIIDTTMQVLGPSSGGGGGGGTVDPTTVAQTGDIKPRYDTAPISGWVRLNGLTIGNATSGATERANADTQALFIFAYNKDPNLPVSGGRTGNALNDFNANKQLTLPDFRGRAMAALADMGNSDVGLFAGVTFQTGNSTTLGSLLGAARRTLTLGQLPTGISASGSNSVSVTSSVNTIPCCGGTPRGDYVTPNSPSVAFVPGALTPWTIGAITSSGSNNINVTSTNTLGQAFDSVSTYALVTVYVKL